MSAFLKRRVGGALILCAVVSLALPAIAQSVPPNSLPDVTLRSTPHLLLVNSRPPSHWGGNMDLNKLAAGATLYLPVFNAGAQFLTGDPHAAQGDGEINGTAIEASLSATLQFVIHKNAGKTMRWPRAEDAANYYTMGMDLNLDVAMREAARETLEFLQQRFGMSPAEAYSLASIAVDFRVAEAVDSTQVIYAAIPKKLFKSTPPYWATP